MAKAIREKPVRTRLGKSSKLRMFIREPIQKDDSYLCMWTIHKLAGKKQNINPTWKVLMKEVDFGRSTSFLDHVYLGCTQRECQTGKYIVDSERNMFESLISAGAMEKLPETKATEKPDAETIFPWSYDMEGHAKKCVVRCFELANKTTQEVHKVATPCIDAINSRKKKWDLLENCHKHALKLFSNAYIWRA